MQHHSEHEHDGIHLPSPTAWPMVMALGVTLIITGMVTNAIISVLGVAMTLAGIIGWFRQMFPVESHEMVPLVEEQVSIASARRFIEQLPIQPGDRKLLPVETFQFGTGVKGGVAGGIAMVVPATLYSLIKYHSLWYAMNLMAAGGFVSWAGQSDAFLAQFHIEGFLAALAIHATASLLVGLLYGAVLPMFPKWPVVTAGFLAPMIWTGLLYSSLGLISPILEQRIDWYWFVPSQIAFGLVAGYFVNRHAKVRTRQFQSLPFALRAGLHGGGGLHDDTHGEGQ